MSWPRRQLLWGATLAVALLWLIVSAISSSPFLFIGAVIYGLALAAFLAAGARPHPDD